MRMCRPLRSECSGLTGPGILGDPAQGSGRSRTSSLHPGLACRRPFGPPEGRPCRGQIYPPFVALPLGARASRPHLSGRRPRRGCGRDARAPRRSSLLWGSEIRRIEGAGAGVTRLCMPAWSTMNDSDQAVEDGLGLLPRQVVQLFSWVPAHPRTATHSRLARQSRIPRTMQHHPATNCQGVWSASWDNC